MIDSKIFYPVSGADFEPSLSSGQRYRNPFNDKRLKEGVEHFLDKLGECRSSTISHLNTHRSDSISMYRLLANPKLTLSELIYESCQIDESAIVDKDLLVALDSSSFNLAMGAEGRKDWVKTLGVVDDNRTPGFMMMPSLVLDASSHNCYGIADILIHSRPKALADPDQNRLLRQQRAKLPLHDKESGAWSIVASNSALQLVKAKRVTFLMDQGGDIYESLALIRSQTQRDFIVRAKVNRQAQCLATNKQAPYKDLLANSSIRSTKTCHIKALHHISKTTKKVVKRKARQAKLHLKTCQIKLIPPAHYPADRPLIEEPLGLVEVFEDPETVPPGEKPIHWILLTSRPIDTIEQAWQIVADYQRRWDSEQLFRLVKKQGYDIENSQLNHPDKIKKLAVMATVVAAKALALVAARDGEQFVEISTQFSEQEVQTLRLMSKRYDKHTQKTSNPHLDDSLAWAAWVIARAGGWSGYQSQRPPGPITMTRGLKQLEVLNSYRNILDDS